MKKQLKFLFQTVIIYIMIRRLAFLMNSQIMNDNIYYLNEWMKYNESLRGNLQIIGNDLVCNINGQNESIDISDYYLSSILYNQNLREQLSDSTKINAEDLFRIVRVNILAEDLEKLEKGKQECLITKMEVKQNEPNSQPFLIFEDNYGHKFKIAKNIEQVVAIYKQLVAKNPQVNFYEFKKELEGLRNGQNH